MISPGLCAQVACLWEVTARKPGNVHRYRDFDDTTYLDFLVSAAAIAPAMEAAVTRSVGETVLRAVKATREVVDVNTNLGIILLLAPLASVPCGVDLRTGVLAVLDNLDVAASRAVYAAIRLAHPSSLGRVAEQDIAEEPTQPLRAIMALAAERDLVARQYANGYREIFDEGLPALREGLVQTASLEGAILHTYLHLLARYPDSLIARKRGLADAKDASRQAAGVLAGTQQMQDLDAWLRAAGNARNPGTTADLVTAVLFVALREAMIPLPAAYPWTNPGGDANPV
jgi:triphosphoribosyl-dephospho-CoA synthase